MDVRRAATRSQGALQAWRSLEPAACTFPSDFMCLVQSSDRHAGPFKEQALLAAATTFKHQGCVKRAAKLAVFTRSTLESDREVSRRTLSRAVVSWKASH